MPRDLIPSLAPLRTFYAVVDTMSFKDAAEKLFVTPSAVSKHIKQIEEHIEAQLFLRDGRSIELTDDGRWFAKQCRALMAEVGNLETAMQKRRNEVSLRLGVPALFGSNFFIPKLSKLMEQHPEIRIDIFQTKAMPDFDIESSDYDAVVWLLPNSEFKFDPVWFEELQSLTYELTGVRPCTNKLQPTKQLMENENIEKREFYRPGCFPICSNSIGIPEHNSNPSLLAEHTWIHNTENYYLWPQYLLATGQSHLRPKKNLMMDLGNMAFQACSQGMGVYFGDTIFLSESQPNIQVACEPGIDSVISYYLVYPKKKAEHPAIVLLNEWLGQMEFA